MPENVGAPLLLADGALGSGDFDTAARLFADAEAATPERDAQAQARHGQACALRAAGEVLTKSGHPLVRSQAMNNLAIMRERAGEFAASVELLKRELVLAREIDDQHGQVVTQINLSRVAAGRREEARDVAFAVLALADRAPVSSPLKEQAAQAVAAAR